MIVYIFQIHTIDSTDCIFASFDLTKAEFVMECYIDAEKSVHNRKQTFDYSEMFSWGIMEMEMYEFTKKGHS